jgi:pimeloyl-ACP methyl ester carboxylesterase
MPLARTRDGAKVYFECHAPTRPGTDRPTIVALPVMGTSGRLYANAIRPGVQAGYRVVTIDHRGSGRSEASERRWSTALGADDVVAVLDEIGVERAHISGASLGGMVAQEVAIRHPARTGALVLFATTGGWPRLDLISPLATVRLARSMIRFPGGQRSVDVRVERALGVWFSRDFAKQMHRGASAREALRAIFEKWARRHRVRGERSCSRHCATRAGTGLARSAPPHLFNTGAPTG